MNKVMLIGNVGKEPEVKYVDAGVCVASVRLMNPVHILQQFRHSKHLQDWHQ